MRLSIEPFVTALNVRPLFVEPRDIPDGALVQAAREGQAWAQEQLFKRYAPMALSTAWRLIPTEDPEDVAQEGLIRALTQLDQLQTPQAFAGWLSTIVVRLATSRLRRRRMLERLGLRGRDRAIDVEDYIAGPASAQTRAELSEVYRMLDTLPAEERVALVLQRVEGLELTEIAARMNLSVATVKRRLTAAASKLEEKRHG